MDKNHFITRHHCPTCKSRNFVEIYSKEFKDKKIRNYLSNFYSNKIDLEYLNNVEFVLEECKNCYTIFQKYIPNEFLNKLIYEVWIDPQKSYEKNIKKNNLQILSLYLQEIMMIIAILNKNPYMLDVLDYGLGWGRWSLMAKALGCNTYGIEISKDKIEFVESKGIKILQDEALNSKKFDFINTEQFFEHIPNPLDTLIKMKKLLKPHGLIKINVPDGHRIKKNLKKEKWHASKKSKYSLNPIHPLEHINCFKRYSIIKMTSMVGLELKNIPISIQLAYTMNWKGINIIKNIMKPIYRNVLNKGTYLFFRNKQLD